MISEWLNEIHDCESLVNRKFMVTEAYYHERDDSSLTKSEDVETAHMTVRMITQI